MRLVGSSILLLAATGCSAVVGTPDEADAQSTSVTGIVVVDRTVGDELTRAEASAHFIRLRGPIDDGALKLVGAPLALPAIGQCANTQDNASARPVELLDVGSVSIEALATGQRTLLASRQVPDVVDLVSGTMYSARVDETSVPSTSDVAVMVGGGAEVPAFSVRAQTPDVPASVHVSAVDATTAEITWAASPRDGVYTDVDGVRCSFADEGRALVPVGEGDAVIALHRIRRERLSIPGLDGGELRFDFARVVTLHR